MVIIFKEPLENHDLKHYRKGVIPTVQVSDLTNVTSKFEETEIDRNFNRVVTSTTPDFSKTNDRRAWRFSVKKIHHAVSDACTGTCISANYYPNLPYLTENPETKTQSTTFCCNEEKGS